MFFYYFYQPGVPTGRVFSSHRDVWLVEKPTHANSFQRNDWCILRFLVKEFLWVNLNLRQAMLGLKVALAKYFSY